MTTKSLPTRYGWKAIYLFETACSIFAASIVSFAAFLALYLWTSHVSLEKLLLQGYLNLFFAGLVVCIYAIESAIEHMIRRRRT